MPCGNCLVGEAEVFGFAPRSAARPALETRPVVYPRIRLGNCDGNRRRINLVFRQFINPLNDLASEPVVVHPVHKRREVRRIARGKRFHPV